MNSKGIFCFTYAGGKASFFNEIEKDLPDFYFVKFEYSGHGARHREPLYQSFDELADDMFGLFKARYDGGDYALFGYSMGTISLVEVLKRIIHDATLPAPCHIILAAHEPLTKAEYAGCFSEKSDAWVKERTICFGAVPDKLKDNKSFWRMYLPLYRADFSIIGKYRFEDLNLISDLPTTVFYSETDTALEDMKMWKNIFTGDCRFYQFEGTHFFIQSHHEKMAEIILQRISGRE